MFSFCAASFSRHIIENIGEPGGDRTLDPMIKSHVLYR